MNPSALFAAVVFVVSMICLTFLASKGIVEAHYVVTLALSALTGAFGIATPSPIRPPPLPPTHNP